MISDDGYNTSALQDRSMTQPHFDCSDRSFISIVGGFNG